MIKISPGIMTIHIDSRGKPKKHYDVSKALKPLTVL